MKKSAVVLALALLLSSLTGAAFAAKTTVHVGVPLLSKVVVLNGATAVQVRLYSSAGYCEPSFLAIAVEDQKGHSAQVSGGCTGGSWFGSISKPNGKPVCGKAKFGYLAKGGYWRLRIPRSCIGTWTDKVRLNSATIKRGAKQEYAGASAWVRRG